MADQSESTSTPSNGGESVLNERLRESIRGEVLVRGDGAYELARLIWNGMVDRRPAVIVRPSGTADVATAIRFARENSLPVAVRGGGHNVAGNAVCDNGMVVDLSKMRHVLVDAENRLVRAGGGALLGDIDHETQAFGLAVPTGVVSATGIGGLTLHGGMGLLTRKFGLTCDNLVGAEVVTADGEILQVDEKNHSDLLWALRGGGGNFGVVTSFQFRAHPISESIDLAMVLYPMSEARRVAGFFRDRMGSAPDELMSIMIFWNAPEEEFIPEAFRGQPVAILVAAWYGAADEGETMLEPFRRVTESVTDLGGKMPFVMAQQMFDADYPDGRRYYWKSAFLDGLSDDVISALIHHAERRPSGISSVDVWALGGAMARVPAEFSAFAERKSPFLLGIEANWLDESDDDANMAWAREAYRDMQRFSSGAMYFNFPGFGEEGEDTVRKSFGSNYERLQGVKAKYDPGNFFSHNMNVRPADLAR